MLPLRTEATLGGRPGADFPILADFPGADFPGADFPILMDRYGGGQGRRIRKRARLRADYLALSYFIALAWEAISVCIVTRLLSAAASPGQESAAAASNVGIAAAIGMWSLAAAWPNRSDSNIVGLPSRLACAACRVLAVTALLVAIGQVAGPGTGLGLLAACACCAFLLVWAGAAAARHLVRALQAHGILAQRVAVIGAPASCRRVAALIGAAGAPGARPGGGIELAGIFAAEDHAAGLRFAVDRVVHTARQEGLDWVLLAGAAPSLPGCSIGADDISGVLARLTTLDVNVARCWPAARGLRGGARIDMIGGIPVQVLMKRPVSGASYVAKAVLDRLVAACLVLLLLPVLVAVALLVRLDSPGPVLFRQRRHGRNNAVIEVLKFRTMRWSDSVTGSGAQQTQRGDQRVTRCGAFLRRASLDELPQLFNVLRGEMSLVGPRPHPVDMRTCGRSGEELVARYAQRHRVKPGITGWAQIHGLRGATHTAEQLERRVRFDLDYIERWSLWLDLGILLRTPWAVLADRAGAF